MSTPIVLHTKSGMELSGADCLVVEEERKGEGEHLKEREGKSE